MKEKLYRNPFPKWDEGTFEKCLLLLQMLWEVFITFEGKKKRSGMEKCKSMQISKSRWYASVEINWWVY